MNEMDKLYRERGLLLHTVGTAGRRSVAVDDTCTYYYKNKNTLQL